MSEYKSYIKNKYDINYTNNNKLSFLSSFTMLTIGILYLYLLFGPRRIKNVLSVVIDGQKTTNEVWIIPSLCLTILLVYCIYYKFRVAVNRNNLFIFIYIFMYLFIILISGLNVKSIDQFIYASILFLFPIFLFITMFNLENKEIKNLIKFFVVICLIYAILAIVLSTNYALFMSLVGNEVYDSYYSQYRASMMLGSSITVSYYFNLTLPFCLYVYFSSTEKKWRIISGIAIIMTIIATLVLLSRVAVLCTIMIVIYSLFFLRKSNKTISRKFSAIFIFIIALVFAFKNYDLSRVIAGMSFSGSSVEERLLASNLGLYIFKQSPIIGSGLGVYFERVYNNRFISVDGISGLVDPHNMYILILSEMGLIGFITTIFLFLTLFKKFSRIDDKFLKHTAYITLIAFMFDSLGGSQLVNEISFASIFWIYMGLFYVASTKNLVNEVKLVR